VTSSAPARLVVGLTGPNAAGKGEAARYLVSRGLTYHSLSDIIREEVAAKSLPPTRENLIEMGNALRQSCGAAILAERTLARLTGRDVVDSIRNPSEVTALRRDPSFVLVAVDAPIELRFARSRSRARPGDGDSIHEFAAREERERGSEIEDPDRTELSCELKQEAGEGFSEFEVLKFGVCIKIVESLVAVDRFSVSGLPIEVTGHGVGKVKAEAPRIVHTYRPK